MKIEEFIKLFPNKIPYGYIPTEIKNNIVRCIRLKNTDLIKKVEELK